jgi:N-acetylmuramoyl-L-alanine amidase
MKCWCASFLGIVAVAASAASPAPTLERVQLFGTEYVRLEQWASAHRFELRWTAPQQSLKASSPSNSLAFTVDSRKMNLDGINVWLSAPVALWRGKAHVGAADLTTALHPVLFPAKTPKTRPIKTICLDPGHGGKDPGNRDGKQLEKYYTLLLAKELKAILAKAGFEVFLTRGSDTFVELPARPEIARQRNADLFLSLHFNAAGGREGAGVSGIEVYCLTPAHATSTNAGGEGGESGAFPGNRLDKKNVLLAWHLQNTLVKQLQVEDRGVRRARFAVLRSARMPAALIEGGFLTNPAEARKINNANYRRRLAEAIAQGVLAYQNAVE